MKPIDRVAIYKGTAVFAGLYILHIVLVPLLVRYMEGGWKSASLFGLSQVVGVLTCVGGGYVAGCVAGERGFLHGFNVGALGAVLSLVASSLWSLVVDLPMPRAWTLPLMILFNGFIGALGGIVATNFERAGGGYWRS